MSKPSKYEIECIDAWHSFNYDIRVSGLKITCIPEKPPFDSIPNYGRPRHERKFKSSVPETIEDADGRIWFKGYDTVEKEKRLLKKFHEWRNTGYWFYNGDRLEFITGDHWYQLSVLKIKLKEVKADGTGTRGRNLPHFIDAHRDLFYFWRMVSLHKYCFGMLFLGYRRFGKTGDAIACKLNKNTQTKDAVSGIQAQNDKFAGRIFKELVAQWRNLPQHPYFFPIHTGESDPASALKFYAPNKSSKHNQRVEINEEALNTIIDFRATNAVAYDGEPISDLLMDEVSKWVTANLTEIMSVNIETLADGLEALGKIYATTTAENIGGKTLPEFIQLWNESDLDKRDGIGQTPSRLWRVFISADQGYRHNPSEDGELPEDLKHPTIDEFGYSDRDRARKVILYARSKMSGETLVRYIRKYPLTAEEALMYSATNCPFDTKKLNTQLTWNENTRVTIGDSVVQGNFAWEPGLEFRRSVWQPSDQGRWLQCWMPAEADRNQWDVQNGILVPTRQWVFTGIDPFDHKTTEEYKHSNGASASLCLGYPITHPEQGFVCIYNNRPPDPYIFYEDMIKQAMFYSSPIMVENQKYGIVKWLEHHGFGGFVEPNPMRVGQKNDGISTKDADLRIAMINGLMAYIHKYVGQRKETDADGDEIEVYGNCPFDMLLKDWIMFNPMQWLKSDLTVASMLSLLALRKVEYEFVNTQSYTLSDWGWGEKKG